MSALLDLLHRNARLSLEELADQLGSSVQDVAAELSTLEKNGTIQGYQTMVDPARL
ncbi:MAG: Lrp/AsnC family transcriptional regulator, partial [Akkermansiaceae bacterium]